MDRQDAVGKRSRVRNTGCFEGLCHRDDPFGDDGNDEPGVKIVVSRRGGIDLEEHRHPSAALGSRSLGPREFETVRDHVCDHGRRDAGARRFQRSNAGQQCAGSLELTGEDFVDDPGYQFLATAEVMQQVPRRCSQFVREGTKCQTEETSRLCIPDRGSEQFTSACVVLGASHETEFILRSFHKYEEHT